MQTHDPDGFALWCDDPICPSRYLRSADTTMQDLRVLSVLAGWTTVGASDFCPAHTGEAAPVHLLDETEEVSLTAEQFTPAVAPEAPAKTTASPAATTVPTTTVPTTTVVPTATTVTAPAKPADTSAE